MTSEMSDNPSLWKMLFLEGLPVCNLVMYYCLSSPSRGREGAVVGIQLDKGKLFPPRGIGV